MKVHYTHTYEDSIMKSTKHCLKKGGKRDERKWKYNGRGELVQSTLYVYIELSQ
jgi:hypothetical protein